MFARSTTINGDTKALDAGISYIRDEVMPMLTDMDGCIGLSMMVDRESGRSITTTSWSDHDTMAASGKQLAPVRAHAAELMGGPMTVDEWEIAIMHRDHDAHEQSCCRVTWVEMDPGAADAMLENYRATVLPALEGMDGFCSASLLVDRTNGRACSTSRWEDREAMQRSAPAGREMREQGARDIGFRILDVAEFDLAIAHLRVPELV